MFIAETADYSKPKDCTLHSPIIKSHFCESYIFEFNQLFENAQKRNNNTKLQLNNIATIYIALTYYLII